MARALISELKFLRVALALWDTLCWYLATIALVSARYDFQLTGIEWSTVLVYPLAAAVLQVVASLILKLYQGRYKVGSFGEASTLAAIVIAVGVVIGLIFGLVVPEFPRGVGLSVPIGALVIMAAGRFAARAWFSRVTEGQHAEDAQRVVIYGAGNAGQQLERLLAMDPDAPYEVVGFIDDDDQKRHLHLGAVKVLGSRKDLVATAEDLGVQTVIMAIPSASQQFLRQLSEELDEAGLRLLVLPPVREIVGGRVELGQLHEVDVADLLGRLQVQTDLSAIAGYLNGKVVLVTGAGGSIGSEIARQVHTYGPKELVLLDRDESGLHGTQLSIYGTGLLDTPDMVLCDVRDLAALDAAFAKHQPQVVFHAAALKHLPMLEQYPEEGWKTNVLGTLAVLDCANRHGVERFVNISTDKAADPTSVLGRTKRTAEELTAWFSIHGKGNYLSVRFGNVLGSRGSVLHTFYHQIAHGGPVTVVHPDITRYFMTIPEACELTIQAGAIGNAGDVLVLDMGEPVRILDVAKRLIRKSGKDIEIVFTGLRKGEKLHEVLFSDTEAAGATTHPLISRVSVPPLDPQLVRDLTWEKFRTLPDRVLG